MTRHITFKKNGVTREVKVGYAWAVALFGPLPFMVRGHWSWCVLTAVLCMFTWGLAGIAVAAYANKATARWLCENGWTITSDPDDVPSEWEIAI